MSPSQDVTSPSLEEESFYLAHKTFFDLGVLMHTNPPRVPAAMISAGIRMLLKQGHSFEHVKILFENMLQIFKESEGD